MVDSRIYRAPLALVLAALIVFGFSFADKPGAVTTTLAPAALSSSAMKSVIGNLRGGVPRSQSRVRR